MKKQDKEIILAVLKALNEDWSLVERGTKEDFMVLINSCRDTKEDLFPAKSLIKEMENLGYIRKTESDYNGGNLYQKLGEGAKWEEVTDSFFLLHFYEVTTRGRDLLILKEQEVI